GELDLGVRTQAPGTAFIELDFQARRGAGAQPGRFRKRQVALRQGPGVGRMDLNFYLALKFTQTGITALPREQCGRNQQQQKTSHGKSPVTTTIASSFPRTARSQRLAGGGPVSAPAYAPVSRY